MVEQEYSMRLLGPLIGRDNCVFLFQCLVVPRVSDDACHELYVTIDENIQH